MPDDDQQGFELPRADQHTFIVGRNGSGKTQQGAWLLSESDFDVRPHIILDFKRDELLNSIPYLRALKPKDKAPRHPGVYIRHSGIDDPHIEDFLGQIWDNNSTHIHVDETYMLDRNSPAFNAILTQGRSKKISATCLSQRPTHCSRWIVSEASNFSVFHLNDKRDQKIIESFVPVELDKVLPEFHAHWYNVKRNFYTLLHPAPDGASILETFKERLKPKRRFF